MNERNEVSKEEFAHDLAALIASITGNRLGPEKLNFVLSKLQQRVSQLGLANIDEYQTILKAVQIVSIMWLLPIRSMGR